MNPRMEHVSFVAQNPLERFNKEQQKIIKERLHTLSSLAYFIGRDHGMKVEVNDGEGWHWDFDKNIVRADPDDLLSKPIEFLRFVMSHEAGHRRISRVFGVIPDETWKLPGFSFMSNAIEDPRDNNFVADNVPHFREEMKYAYGKEGEDEQFEQEMGEEANKRFGKRPRFMQAGFEYIKLWYRVSSGEGFEISPELPDDVKEVVLATYESAKQSWNTYPTLTEADEGLEYRGKQLSGEEVITEYARASFQINYNKVWPLFKTLIDKDIEDAKNGKGKGGGQGGGEGGGDAKPLTEEEARELVREFAEKLAKHFEGEKIKADDIKNANIVAPEAEVEEEVPSMMEKDDKPFTFDDDAIQVLKQKLEQRNHLEQPYEKIMRECAPLIDRLTHELKEIFDKRRHTGWEAGYKSGKKIHIGKVIQEEVSQTSPFETGAFMRKEQPKEMDYAITLLIDLSSSMGGQKIKEAFKATVVLAEVLNQIGINFSVTGFNCHMYDYKNFDQEMDDEIRQKSEEMLREVGTRSAGYNDDGWALNEVNKKIRKREERQKIVFVISDGQPVPSYEHADYDLKQTIERILDDGKVKIIGLGLGRGTEHVRGFYPNSVANITVQQLAEVLGDTLREAIKAT